MHRGLVRLIDANANRASEGLRVMEDLARFRLDDPALALELKVARHDLGEALGRLFDRAVRLASRDTPSDVGTGLSTQTEQARASLAAVAGGGTGRAGEALRVLEEAAKIGGDGRAFEALRYRVYELGRRLEIALAGGRARQWKLCVLITRSLCVHHPWQRVAEQAIAGGAGCLQLREKTLDTRELVASAKELVGIARGHGVSVVVNDRVDVAMAAGGDGVHLGRGDLGVREARLIAGSSLLVGVSCSTLGQAQNAAREGADYIGLGAMFVSTTKPKDSLAGLGLVREVVGDPMASRMPHLAISGIDRENVAELSAVGCLGVAVSSAVCGSEDPAGACRAIIEGLGS